MQLGEITTRHYFGETGETSETRKKEIGGQRTEVRSQKSEVSKAIRGRGETEKRRVESHEASPSLGHYATLSFVVKGRGPNSAGSPSTSSGQADSGQQAVFMGHRFTQIFI
jgi:hypothetical protein